MSDCRSVEDRLIGEDGVRELRGQAVGRVIYMDIETYGYSHMFNGSTIGESNSELDAEVFK